MKKLTITSSSLQHTYQRNKQTYGCLTETACQLSTRNFVLFSMTRHCAESR